MSKKEPKKSNPIIGIAEWLASEARFEDAATVLSSVKKSKKSTDEDVKEAEKLTKLINTKSRKHLEAIVEKTVKLRKVDDLTPNKDVEEKMLIKASDFARIKEDVDERGVQVPIVVNEKDEVICGISRWKACKELNIEDIPVFEGNWEDYTSMMDYAIRDNICRRQLVASEVSSLEAYTNRMKDIPVVGRPLQIQGTKREVEAAVKKANKVITKDREKILKKVRETTQIFEKNYKLVVGKNHVEDKQFASKVSQEIKSQIELLTMDKVEINIYIKYEVKK